MLSISTMDTIVNVSLALSLIRQYYYAVISCSYYPYITREQLTICCYPLVRLQLQPLLDTEIEKTCEGLRPSSAKRLHSIGQDNVATVVEYIAAMKRKLVNPSNNYRRNQIEVLTRLSKYNNNKPFKELTRTDIISFLETLQNRNIRPNA